MQTFENAICSKQGITNKDRLTSDGRIQDACLRLFICKRELVILSESECQPGLTSSFPSRALATTSTTTHERYLILVSLTVEGTLKTSIHCPSLCPNIASIRPFQEWQLPGRSKSEPTPSHPQS